MDKPKSHPVRGRPDCRGPGNAARNHVVDRCQRIAVVDRILAAAIVPKQGARRAQQSATRLRKVGATGELEQEGFSFSQWVQDHKPALPKLAF